MTRIIFLLLVALLMVSCDNGYYEENDVGLQQLVYIISDSFTSDVASSIYPMQTTMVEKGQSVKFVAGYNINGEISTSDTTAKYYTSVLWEIDGEFFNINTFRYTFKKSGIINGSLRTIDLYGDTLVSDIVIYVNTPEEFSLLYPYDGYNQASPNQSQDYPFRWSLSGIDEWESAECNFYISIDSNQVWMNRRGSVDCQDGINLWGPLVGDSAILLAEGIDLRKVYYTFYWGVEYIVKVGNEVRYTELSNVNRFTTKLLEDDKSVVYIPIEYDGFFGNGTMDLNVTAVSALGDTIHSTERTGLFSTLILNLQSQTGVKIYLEELSKKEFLPESIVVDLPAGAAVRTPTVQFRDYTPPQIALTNSIYDPFEFAAFVLYDDGSGVSQNLTKVLMDGIPVIYKYEGDTLFFSLNNCTAPNCKLVFLSEDRAGNQITDDTYWNVIFHKEDYYYTIEGPFKESGK